MTNLILLSIDKRWGNKLRHIGIIEKYNYTNWSGYIYEIKGSYKKIYFTGDDISSRNKLIEEGCIVTFEKRQSYNGKINAKKCL